MGFLEKIIVTPSITGFGLSDFHLLKVVQPSDWLRDAFYAYDVLAAAAEKVDVIGFSNGGCLAAILAQNRPVDKLILASPYLAANPRERLFYTLFRTPVFKRIVPFLIPLGKKPKLAGRADTLDALNLKPDRRQIGSQPGNENPAAIAPGQSDA